MSNDSIDGDATEVSTVTNSVSSVRLRGIDQIMLVGYYVSYQSAPWCLLTATQKEGECQYQGLFVTLLCQRCLMLL